MNNEIAFSASVNETTLCIIASLSLRGESHAIYRGNPLLPLQTMTSRLNVLLSNFSYSQQIKHQYQKIRYFFRDDILSALDVYVDYRPERSGNRKETIIRRDDILLARVFLAHCTEFALYERIADISAILGITIRQRI